MLQVLAQVPVLWVWDNVEPVTGFPAGTQSDWTQAEQDDLAGLLRDLAQRTRCKVLVTSRRDEHAWLGDLPARVQLPRDADARKSAAGCVRWPPGTATAWRRADWRPLLRYAAGNPLTITVLVGQALRDSLATTEQIEGFVARLRAGEAQLEAGEDAALGRTRSLAASLSYGFAQAFTEAERAQLAVLHLFRDTADADALRFMGDRGGRSGRTRSRSWPGWTATPRSRCWTGPPHRPAGIRSAAATTRSTPPCRGTSPPCTPPPTARPAAPPPSAPPAPTPRPSAHSATTTTTRPKRATRPRLCQCWGRRRPTSPRPDLARAGGLWDAAVGCLQGLRVLYERTGRDGEWARLVASVTPDFTDPATGGPLPGRDDEWSLITEYRVRLAWQARDWPAATALQNASIAWNRDQAAAALAAPRPASPPSSATRSATSLFPSTSSATSSSSRTILAASRTTQEALTWSSGSATARRKPSCAVSLGNAYLMVPGLRDLDQAEHWFQRSLSLRADSDRLGRARMPRVSSAWSPWHGSTTPVPPGRPEAVLLEHLNTALRCYQQALDLTPADDHEYRAIIENQLGTIYGRAGDTRQALRHYQQSIQHDEARGDIYGAGQTRYNIALLLADDGRVGDALLMPAPPWTTSSRPGPAPPPPRPTPSGSSPTWTTQPLRARRPGYR